MIATGGLRCITSAVMRLGQWAKAGCIHGASGL
jgi:hypothetical protein